MTKKIFWKDIRQSFTLSLGRFLSIMLLMFLGAFALIGLKVAGPDLQRSASHYLKQHKTMDLSVLASSGFSASDQAELKKIKGARVEFGYVTDVTVKGKDEAVRLFSKSKGISTYQVVSGRLPKTDKEIALSTTMEKSYHIGERIQFDPKTPGVLKETSYKIVGFVNSSEVWSAKQNLGTSTAGDGQLTGYAVTASSSFSGPYGIARLGYQQLKHLNPFSSAYTKALTRKQEELDAILADNGKKRLTEIKASRQATLNDEQARLNTAKSQLNQKEQGLAYLTGASLQAAQSQIAQTKVQLNQNQAKLNAAQEQLNRLEQPTYKTYTRTTLSGGEGYRTYQDISHNLSRIGNLFPVVLYLVAALVTFTTMTRFVNEERDKSGLLKALGYSNRDVLKKFVSYGLVAGVIGTALGILGGHYFLPRIVTKNAVALTTIGQPKLYFYWSYSLIALVLALLSAVLPAFLVARRELGEMPAQLLQAKPPVAGAKILLERLPLLWKHLSFTQKVTLRNIFRYKQRMLMTIIGVAGSVTLLFAGLGMQSSLGQLVHHQFQELTPYDLMVVRNQQASPEQKQAVDNFLASDEVVSHQAIYSQTIDEKIAGQNEKKSISILVTSQKNFGQFIRLKLADTGKTTTLSNSGALITKKLSDYYHVKAGDTFDFKDSDGKTVKIKVASIVKMNVGHDIFMSKAYYQTVFGESPQANSDLVNLRVHGNSSTSQKASQLLKMKGIAAVSQNTSSIRFVNTAIKGLNASMTILVVVSLALAIVILYNLTTINIAERMRELSTIKVLGFHSREVMLYIYRETILQSIVGVLLGLLGGYGLHRALILMMSQDMVYPTTVTLRVYLIPVILIVAILVGLGYLVYHRLKTVDMLEALKSID